MPRHNPSLTSLVAATALAAVVLPHVAAAQAAPPPAPRPYTAGKPLGVTSSAPNGGAGPFVPISTNVSVFGAIESCAYDAGRGLIVVPNRGVAQSVLANDGFVSLIKHDGSVHTSRWIGVQPPAERHALTPPLTLNDPFGSEIAGGVLYIADSDGGTRTDDPQVAVIRKFDMKTGAPAGEVRVERSTWLNDLAIAGDGTIYATQSGDFGPNAKPESWQVLAIAPDGAARTFAQGAPLNVPNGVAFDPQGNVVVVNTGDSAVLTFSPAGKLLKTEHAAQAGSDGLVIMRDGTKYVSSVLHGGVSRIRPGRPAQLIAHGIPSAASMCYDAGANRLVIPMTSESGLAFIKLR